ncbi:MAG: thioesterase family protein [Gemmataceae bacterium]
MPTFTTTRIVEFSDTDMAGIVHFAEYFRYMEAAEHAFLRSRGIQVFHDWAGQRLTFPRVSATCDYLAPARFGDTLTLEVAVAHLGRTSIRYAHSIQREGTTLARGAVTAVLCRVRDDHTLEPFLIPDELRQLLTD